MQIHLIENSTVTVDNEVISLGDLSITQGLSYYLTFYIRSNYKTWTPKGQIRTSLFDEGGLVETEFLFYPNLYNQQQGFTFIRPYLKASTTKELMSTFYQNKENDIPSKDNCFVYNIVLINPSDPDDIQPLIDVSYVQVKPGVTI